VGGDFTKVNGREQRSLASLDLNTGQLRNGFQASVDGDVRALTAHGANVYVGGRFGSINGVPRAGLARVDARSGRLDEGFNAQLADGVNSDPRAQAMSLSPGGTRLAVIGNFARAQGLTRHQLVILDVTGPRAVVTDWSTGFYHTDSCDARFDSYVRGIDHAPDGSYLVVTTTGHDSAPNLPCNTAAHFETAGSGEHSPTWINHTGGHSLYAVAATASALSVMASIRWSAQQPGIGRDLDLKRAPGCRVPP
jgi:hypothetical protein